MGEARRRGSFEQRREQAIAAGRIKRRESRARQVHLPIAMLSALATIAGAFKRARSK